MSKRFLIPAKKQRGLVLILVTFSMVVLIAVTAFAVDVNHALLSKTKVQNGVDAAALAGAVVLDNGGTTAQATAAVNQTLTNMTSSNGNAAVTFSSSTVNVEYSNDPRVFPDNDFSASLDTYVRVSVLDLPLQDFFAGIFGISKAVDASAVAGPSPTLEVVINVVPIAVCDGANGASGISGYNAGDVYALTVASNRTTMGPGNYQLLDFGSGNERDELAGSYEGELKIGDTVRTNPGISVGNVSKGLNTRFGDYSGGMNASTYPPDIYVKEPDQKASIDRDGNVTYDDGWGYDDYLAAIPCASGGADCNVGNGGAYNRRILPVPIVDCTTTEAQGGGVNNLTVLEIGCFFMLQKAPTNNSGKQGVFGEFLEDCSLVGGNPGDNSDSDGPYRIVLYDDPLSEES
ncbi:pilus assembly protein TadG-related protein [Vibrio astriarenae]|uniref:pilus assembly protein TadG-related protein n=1 Tax=Vibrio astriarenae TaxID=1481923 RepID=UPI0037353D12